MRGSVVERFRAMVAFDEDRDECWLWTGYIDGDGYGHFMPTHGTNMLAHRYAYTLWVGPIPEDLTIDHLCFHTACVNPRHLEACTIQENIRRAVEHRPVRLCEVAGCDRLHVAHGMCRRHYVAERYQRLGHG